MIKYEIDEKGFLTGNWASIGWFPNQVELENPLPDLDLNLQWNGVTFIKGSNPKVEQKLLEDLRKQREQECFSVINRGAMWYNTLTSEQLKELQEWYNLWLDVTITKTVPAKPSWLK